MIEQLLAPEVCARETRTELPGRGPWPVEQAQDQRWVESRRIEFTTARECARGALAALGHDPVGIGIGPDREPRWPEGVVGSITHCTGYRAAAVAHARDVRSVGIDAEPHAPLPDEVATQAVMATERAEVARLEVRRPDICWDRVLFSAKESVYKAWWPLARRWLGFEDAELSFDDSAGTFSARLLVAGPVVDGVALRRLHGRWRVGDGLVLTGVTVPAPVPDGPS